MNAHPSPGQIAWHDREIGMFIHFGLYTYRERNVWQLPGDPGVFDPFKLDPGQWVDVAQSLGAKYIVFTAKHADGFCLWQTETTDFSVRSAPWMAGRGDVVEGISAACAEAGMDFGIYLSPADASFGASVGGRTSDTGAQHEYDRIFRAQLTELLTRYGKICEVWFDGSCATDVGDILSQYAPDAMVFQGEYATIRWVGNEAGFAPYPAWNAVRADDARTGIATAAHGDPDGEVWLPLEVDTTIRDHYWMWERDTEESLKSLEELMTIYYRSVGHGTVLLLNSNPDRTGRIPRGDAQRAAEFGAEIERRFSSASAEYRGSGEPMESEDGEVLKMAEATPIDHVVSMEDVSQGEVVHRYVIEGECDGVWRELARGESIGHKKIDFFPTATVSSVRLRVLEASNTPRFRRVSTYYCGAIPRFDRGEVTIHDPFLLYEWPVVQGDEWTSPLIDLTQVCTDARRYTCELRPNGFDEVESVQIELFHEGTRVDGYVGATGDPLKWDLTISAYDSSYMIRLTLRYVGRNGTGGSVYLR